MASTLYLAADFKGKGEYAGKHLAQVVSFPECTNIMYAIPRLDDRFKELFALQHFATLKQTKEYVEHENEQARKNGTYLHYTSEYIDYCDELQKNSVPHTVTCFSGKTDGTDGIVMKSAEEKKNDLRRRLARACDGCLLNAFNDGKITMEEYLNMSLDLVREAAGDDDLMNLALYQFRETARRYSEARKAIDAEYANGQTDEDAGALASAT